ncbi:MULTISPECIES: serine/threonine protein kinase [Nostocales]|uniref:Serine/threonine protein kinase n=3 Tax=Nostocales TaxID=1161 RepID=A0A0C1RE04_9CYAN|nr:serine/threonine-protein kinase [Tolypothrix bouteillei]KAF3886423.1 serine/threonine protein kinase [Tolypothrix bouteillei VB521301]
MLEVGQILQTRYQLKENLGQNGGRQTWLAEDLKTQPSERVIVKLLTFGDRVQWESLRLFEREANILKQLDHPRIPKYRDYFSIDDRILWFGLVQDFIPGSSLRELLTQGQKFSEKQIRQIATDILNILVYLHELNPAVLHRDIKPSNLILGEDKRIYLVDFGAVQDRAITERATFTVIGTYGYAPMEQFGGRAVPASDLYALGASLIHLLTGIPPADLPQRKMRIQFSDRVSIDPHLIRWIEILTEPDVEERFSTARQALKALDTPQNSKTYLPIHKPQSSRIQIKKSARKLNIKLPKRGLKTLDFCSLIIGLTASSLFAGLFSMGTGLGPLILLAGSILSLSSLIAPLTETNVDFQRDTFTITWSILGKRYRYLDGNTQDIHNVYVYIYQSKGGEDSSERMKLIVAAGEDKYKFGDFDFKTSEPECLWLIQEIKDWLGLR